MSNDVLRHFFGGFVRLHILYHASKGPICGVQMIEELGRHGYKLSPGTLYPILSHLHEADYLSCKPAVVDNRRRKNYRITPKGKRLLAEAQARLKELFSEVVEDRDRLSEGKSRPPEDGAQPG